MSEKLVPAWAYVMVQVSVADGEITNQEQVLAKLRRWYMKRYGGHCSTEVEQPEAIDGTVRGLGAVFRFGVDKKYNPHRVAKKVEKKMAKLLAAQSES
ncbi:MAG: hypothetical protein ACHQTE_02050 [Candidatus Saccharimonadales bacterium]